MLATLLKILFFYFVFIFIRGLWRSYLTVQQLKKMQQQDPIRDQFRQRPQPKARPGQSYDNGQTVEAEFRTISESD